MDAWRKMLPHLFSQDWYIGVWAVVTVGLLLLTRYLTKEVQTLTAPDSDLNMLRTQRQKLNVCYSAFTAFISIFPLWGMFGTVTALLALDMNGDLSSVQENFFTALTSTAWGILFAIAFKVLNAVLVSSKTEEVLEKTGRILDRPARPPRGKA
ncbi:MAG: MotA/TolQ/ExbB proton channel family protein [Oscillospiraceae bacterium]|nr:MotA/TolQ/ExbB proton channel family protein [Oscillospiraceae bacterium]